mgnify:CR=1 FL=1
MIWDKIERLLIEKGMNQRQLAIKMGVSPGVISDLKKRRIVNPSFKLICKLANALDVATDYFREEKE